MHAMLAVWTLLGVAASSDPWPAAASTVDETADSYTTAYLNVTSYDVATGVVVQTEKSEIGKFGEYHVGAASGMLLHVIGTDGDRNGCAPPVHGVREPPDAGPWIALVRRGKCSFQTKVDNARRAGASAVIVYNDREATDLDKMKLLPSDPRNVSAIFTYKWKGEDMARMLDDMTRRVMVKITIASHCTRPYGNINRTSVLFVSISFIVLMVISLAWLVFYYIQRFRYIHAKDQLSRRLCNAAKKALSKIPTKHIKMDDKEIVGDGDCCAVCIEPYKPSEVVRILPCRHEFHKSCVDPWLLEHRTCPMCKMDILKHYGFLFTGSQESFLHVEVEEVTNDFDVYQYARGRSFMDTAQNSRTIPDVAAVAVAATVVCESPDSRSSTPDELTPALAQRNDGGGGGGGSRGDDRITDVATNCTTVAAGTNRSTSFDSDWWHSRLSPLRQTRSSDGF
ncbi:PREDICTED: protein goliath isoform X1 [Diuraphis noxia]|uniref:protein goliath isoform X1 n=1 Tax=Diuraphis noxia TaxID=143948 RepID=UPI000763AA82|nr:PREDICTED: protein goliath isoform X1 [Diuraphis noxia]XP_015374519.1 PREDICTED: protein goliath isoform X1 [Diuraphis noxia]